MEKSLLLHDVQIRQGVYLPHWTVAGGTYAVTFRLADALPRPVLAAWREERALLLAECEAVGALDSARAQRLRALGTEKLQQHLDAGHGACWLRRPEIAGIVADALRHFDGTRHRLIAWCVMPNHVHVVVQPLAPHSLPGVVQSWKGFSARVANVRLGRRGAFWQEETYDHLVRDDADLAHAVRYVAANPARAGLHDWPWVWVSDEVREWASGPGFPARGC